MYPNYNMFYGFNGLNDFNFFRNANESQMSFNEELITLSQAIDSIRKSIDDEREDELFYNSLISNAPNEEAKNIINSIRNDEKKHNKILKKLYYDFTGQMIQINNNSPVNNPSTSNYKDDLETALFSELNAVEKYRRILGTTPMGDDYTLVMSIMTDELRHANLYNYLIHKANM